MALAPCCPCPAMPCRRQAFALEIDNKKLSRALAREVGEDVPLARVLEEGSDWKGRREQLIALRDQVGWLEGGRGPQATAATACGACSGAGADANNPACALRTHQDLHVRSGPAASPLLCTAWHAGAMRLCPCTSSSPSPRRDCTHLLALQVKSLKAALGQAGPESRHEAAAKQNITKIAKERGQVRRVRTAGMPAV